MKNLKLFLDDEREEDLNIGLIRLAKDIPPHELFFTINTLNTSKFRRLHDLPVYGRYYDYWHMRFQAYDAVNKSCIEIFSNRSAAAVLKQEQAELFAEEDEINYLLPFHREADYIIKTSDNVSEFSLILWPENIMFPIQNACVSSQDTLFELIQYYE